MSKITMVIHGGAGPDSEYIKKNMDGYKQGLQEAVNTGYRILEEGGSAMDAVEAAVNYLEDNELFNADFGYVENSRVRTGAFKILYRKIVSDRQVGYGWYSPRKRAVAFFLHTKYGCKKT